VSRTAFTSSCARRGGWSLDDVQHIVLDGVSWELYEHLLKEVGDRPIRLTYDNGELEIMSPLPEHEFAKITIAAMIVAITEALDMPRAGLGSTTFRRRLKKKGLEPDDCVYIKSQPLIVGKKRIDPLKAPPPDLAVEIDITSRSIARLPIYAALGVPEIWRYDGKTLTCLHLRKGGYVTSEHSLAFPKLRVSDLRQFIRIADEKRDQNASLKAFRAWLRKQSWVR
jgi:Uma2 family endonuclease